GVLHQHQTRNAELLTRSAIERAHLFTGEERNHRSALVATQQQLAQGIAHALGAIPVARAEPLVRSLRELRSIDIDGLALLLREQAQDVLANLLKLLAAIGEVGLFQALEVAREDLAIVHLRARMVDRVA